MILFTPNNHDHEKWQNTKLSQNFLQVTILPMNILTQTTHQLSVLILLQKLQLLLLQYQQSSAVQHSLPYCQMHKAQGPQTHGWALPGHWSPGAAPLTSAMSEILYSIWSGTLTEGRDRWDQKATKVLHLLLLLSVTNAGGNKNNCSKTAQPVFSIRNYNTQVKSQFKEKLIFQWRALNQKLGQKRQHNFPT